MNPFFPVFTILVFHPYFSVPRGPKGLDGAGGDPGEVAQGAGRGAEGPGVDGGEAAVFVFFKVDFFSFFFSLSRG